MHALKLNICPQYYVAMDIFPQFLLVNEISVLLM